MSVIAIRVATASRPFASSRCVRRRKRLHDVVVGAGLSPACCAPKRPLSSCPFGQKRGGRSRARCWPWAKYLDNPLDICELPKKYISGHIHGYLRARAERARRSWMDTTAERRAHGESPARRPRRVHTKLDRVDESRTRGQAAHLLVAPTKGQPQPTAAHAGQHTATWRIRPHTSLGAVF